MPIFRSLQFVRAIVLLSLGLSLYSTLLSPVVLGQAVRNPLRLAVWERREQRD